MTEEEPVNFCHINNGAAIISCSSQSPNASCDNILNSTRKVSFKLIKKKK